MIDSETYRTWETLRELTKGLSNDPDDVRLLDAETKPFYAQLLLMTEKEVVDRQLREMKETEDRQKLSDMSEEERRGELARRKKFNDRELFWFRHVQNLKAQQQEVRPLAVSKLEFLNALELVPRSPSKSSTEITPTPATFTVSIGDESIE
jgi:hypothetical protein